MGDRKLQADQSPLGSTIDFLRGDLSRRTYENRDGFDPSFLPKHSIPLPKLGTKQKQNAARKRRSRMQRIHMS